MRKARDTFHFNWEVLGYQEGHRRSFTFKEEGYVDRGKNTSQQRGSLPIPQVPIRLVNIWYGSPDGIMDLLPF